MRDHVRRAAGAMLLAIALTATPRAEQAGRLSEAVGDGTLRSELSLVGRTATIGVNPGLKTTGPEHQRVAGPAGDAARVRIGYLVTNGVLQFGAVNVGKLDAVGVRFDLSLVHAASGWQLIAEPAKTDGQAGRPAEAAESAAAVTAATIPLAPLTAKPNTRSTASALTAAWLPVGRETAQLLVTWGEVALSADVQFVEPKMPRNAGRPPGAPLNRAHDEPNRGARQLMLSQLNETALVLPAGPRFSAMFARSFARGQRSVSAAATISRAGLGADGPDYAKLMATANGAVVELTEAAVPRLLVGAPLRFGKVSLRPGNQAPGYPGAYGLWLKRVANNGWRLVVNGESDVWGTQHDPKFDVAEVELQHVEGGEATRPFAIALLPTSADRGRLVIAWGAHEWSAEFVTAN